MKTDIEYKRIIAEFFFTTGSMLTSNSIKLSCIMALHFT